ncbi:MAG: hypothetical protein RJA35_1443 [Actinomycetota bacterium]|jgi:hypothetical protein
MSKAIIAIERPARWAKQLGSHLGHKLSVEEVDGGWKFVIDGAVGHALVTGESELTLTAEGDTDELRHKMEFILQKHLVRFAEDLQPEVNWI